MGPFLESSQAFFVCRGHGGMVIWDLRRTGDLIGLANSIAGAEQGEVDGKDVGFVGFEALLNGIEPYLHRCGEQGLRLAGIEARVPNSG